jgi:glycine betaine/proline transport system permease protein
MPEIFGHKIVPLEDWAEDFTFWVAGEYRPFFQAVKWPVEQLLENTQDLLLWLPDWLVILALAGIALRVAGRGVAIFTVLSMLTIGFLGLWHEAMVSLAMVNSAVIFCAVIGIPLGILGASSDRADRVMRPMLDAMQTTPSFVFLVPVVMLFSTGTVAGVIATVIFAMPPIVRLTNLGIRDVSAEAVEAAYAFGAESRQVLFDVQIPLASRTIMAGLNQTLMMAISMIVIASIIGAGGLGEPVRRGINNFQPGLAVIGGISVVLLAMVLDRITQALGSSEA